jgi:hypothetical protein
MEHYQIILEGKHFQKNYLIYVISVINEQKGNYYYVGQTGDRNYRTARPAFSRLAGHFRDLKSSTENQVYKGILEKILKYDSKDPKNYTEKIKNTISEYLSNSKVIMDVFPIIKFEPTVEMTEHKKNLSYVENIEKYLIKKLSEHYNSKDRILNKKIHKPIEMDDSEEVAEKIYEIIIQNNGT